MTINITTLTKKVNTNNYYKEMVNPHKMKAQYNPKRFHLWKSLHRGPEKEVLNMLYSPHYRFLKNRKDGSYYQLQRFFGRNDRWIQDKINQFLSIFESIKKNGFLENVSVVDNPLVKNPYNSGLEIFEGHHRIACALVLGLKLIPCEIIRRNFDGKR